MLQPVFDPFPELSTERLFLRQLKLSDAPSVYFLRSDKDVLKYLSKEPVSCISEAEDFISGVNGNIETNSSVMWAITLHEDTEKVIGTICYWRLEKEHYRAEIGYVLDPAFWRKGIMKEAILKILDYGFSILGLHSVEARLNPNNIASASVLESTGFVKEAHFKEDFFFQGNFEDTAVYSRLNNY